jgi:hypothetical protein
MNKDKKRWCEIVETGSSKKHKKKIFDANDSEIEDIEDSEAEQKENNDSWISLKPPPNLILPKVNWLDIISDKEKMKQPQLFLSEDGKQRLFKKGARRPLEFVHHIIPRLITPSANRKMTETLDEELYVGGIRRVEKEQFYSLGKNTYKVIFYYISSTFYVALIINIYNNCELVDEIAGYFFLDALTDIKKTS